MGTESFSVDYCCRPELLDLGRQLRAKFKSLLREYLFLFYCRPFTVTAAVIHGLSMG